MLLAWTFLRKYLVFYEMSKRINWFRGGSKGLKGGGSAGSIPLLSLRRNKKKRDVTTIGGGANHDRGENGTESGSRRFGEDNAGRERKESDRSLTKHFLGKQRDSTGEKFLKNTWLGRDSRNPLAGRSVRKPHRRKDAKKFNLRTGVERKE